VGQSAEFRYRGPVGASANKDFVNIFSIGFSISAETECNFLVKRVDEEIKKLVLADFSVCLLGIVIPSASRSLN
jgi:hypothetical protein